MELRVVLIFSSLCMVAAEIVMANEKSFTKFSDHRKTFETENAHIGKLTSDIVTKAVASHLSGPIPLVSAGYQRPVELAIEWRLRDKTNVNKDVKEDPFLSRVSNVKNGVYFDQLLIAKLDSFQKSVFFMDQQALIKVRREFRDFLLKSRKSLINQSQFLSWWKWFLADDLEASKYEFTGFDSTQSPLLQAVSFFFARTFLQGEMPFQELLENRYILNGDSESRVLLAKFDSGPLKKYFLKLHERDLSLWKSVLMSIEEPRLVSQRVSVLRQWLGESVSEWKREKLLSCYLRDKTILGEPLLVAEMMDLVNLRLNQGMVSEANSVLKMIPQTKDNTHVVHYLTGRVYENLSKQQTEPARSQTLKWAAEKYRLSLNNHGSLSALRDEILWRYAVVLEKSDMKSEASEVWETFFRAGLTRETRLKALKSWIHNLFDLSENIKTADRSEKFRKAVSLSGFYAQAGADKAEVRSLSARIRYVRRLLKIDGDQGLEASLFEIEKAGGKSRAKN